MIVAPKSSRASLETDPAPIDSGNTVTWQTSDTQPPNIADFCQDKDKAFGDNNVIISLIPSTDVESSAFDSKNPDDPSTEKVLDNLDLDSSTSALGSLTDTSNLEAWCPPKNSATSGKMRKRLDDVCGNEDDVDPNDIKAVEAALARDLAWRKAHAAVLMKGK